MGQFKRYLNPITKAVYAGYYMSPLAGSDSNNGTISSPIATLTKFSTYGVSKTILINGKTIENTVVPYGSSLIGDCEASECSGNITLGTNGSVQTSAFGIKFSSLTGVSSSLYNCVIDTFSNNSYYDSSIANVIYILNNFFSEYNAKTLGLNLNNFKNNTIWDYKNYINGDQRIACSTIFINSIDLYNFSSLINLVNYPIFKHCLFRKATIWKWNGVIIPINYGTYGNESDDYLADVISAMYAYTGTVPVGAERNYFSAMFPNAISSPVFYVDQNGQTCKVVEDRPSVVGSKKIFNRYVGDNPVDYSLFLHVDNVALIMSDELSYVGCYKANADVLTFGDVMSVNVDGSDDLITPPDMLIYDGNGKFRVSIADSVQTRNRVRSSVFHFKRGFTLDGFQSQMKSGLSSRFSLGKFQPYNITDAPTLPQESIEVIPYDDAVTPSAFPRFSAMFNDKVQMWYHAAGSKVGLPVLFNDLLAYFTIVTDKSLAEYGSWAVTNADYETFTLSTKANVKLQNVPVYFAQVEINLNYHV